MRARQLAGLVTLVVLGWSADASAVPMVDFSTLSVGGKITDLGTGPKTVGKVTAQAYYKTNGGGTWTATNLIARNETGDHGFGVCSPTEKGNGQCNIGATGGGDWNELSQLYHQEAILLTIAPDWDWSQLWVSSLDSGGTGGKERGKIYWGDTNNIANLITQATAAGDTFIFDSSQMPPGQVEGNILALAQASIFDKNAKYVLFMPNGNKGDNNDYLVYGAGVTAVPEPGTVLLLIGAAAGAMRLRRRKLI